MPEPDEISYRDEEPLVGLWDTNWQNILLHIPPYRRPFCCYSSEYDGTNHWYGKVIVPGEEE